MLSAKRCGSTAIFKMFQQHPDVGVCHVNQDINNWEPNFWNLGARAIDGFPDDFISRFKESHPFLSMPDQWTEETLFQLWDTILEKQGPVIFDKSPQYLGNVRVFELLKKYSQQGNDVRFFAVIRDPRDAISSQYELWKSYLKDDSPSKREIAWLKKYHHLEQLQQTFAYIPLFRYEDFSVAPICYGSILLDHCGCSQIVESYQHIRPTSIGRYSASISPKIRFWHFSQEFKEHLKKYGYQIPQLSIVQRIVLTVKMFKGNIRRELSSIKNKLS